MQLTEKKIEAVAKLPKGVPADIKDFETVFAYLEKEGVSPGDREKGTMCGQMWMV